MTAPSPARRSEDAQATALVIVSDHQVEATVQPLLAAFHVIVEPSVRSRVFETARQSRVDLVVLCEDDATRLASGLEVLSEISYLEDVPVLVVASEGADLAPLLTGRADDAVRRPFSSPELLARARNLAFTKNTRDALTEQLIASRDELHAVVAQIVAKRRELESSLHETRLARSIAERAAGMKSNLLRMMAHELRTPVAAVQLQIELLERDGLETESQREIVVRMRRTLSRLLELIETALEYARIESGRYELHATSFALQDTLHEVAKDHLPLAEHKGLELNVTAEVMPEVASDENLVRLVASNLLGNALKFTSEGGVVVRAWHDDGRHVFAVEDTGPGIPPERHAEVFEPFSRGDDVRFRTGTGSGLGLALVKEMVSALGGTIQLASAPTGGARFEVAIPSEPSALAPDREPG
ncbi:MAG: ATP-binding protein [Deltaproteobacteria bacterium]